MKDNIAKRMSEYGWSNNRDYQIAVAAVKDEIALFTRELLGPEDVDDISPMVYPTIVTNNMAREIIQDQSKRYLK